MITELAEIRIKRHSEQDFEAAVAKAVPLFQSAKGCHHFQLLSSIEEPLLYRLLVSWETVEDHVDGFRQSPAFAQWRELVVPFMDGTPRVEHLDLVIGAF